MSEGFAVSTTMTRAKMNRILANHRAAERDAEFFIAHPELLEPYRGEWIVTHAGRVVAHSLDGSEAARQAPATDYPGPSFFYLPTREELAGFHII
jgi:hypothetical protein